MEKKQGKGVGTLILLFFLIPLLTLFYYLWTYNYDPQPLNDTEAAQVGSTPLPATQLFAQIHLDEATLDSARLQDTRRPVLAELRLVNASGQPVTILDTPLPSPLVSLTVAYLGSSSGHKAPEILPVTGAMSASSGARKGRQAAVELLPGRKLCMTLPLTPAYNFNRPGRYRVEATYQPQRYASESAVDLNALGVYAFTLVASEATFEVLPAPAAEAGAEKGSKIDP